MERADKLAALRGELEKQGLDGFLVPRADEFQGEYVPACAERLAWLTGFTGSAGVAVVLKDRAMVQSDSRYTLQLDYQIDQGLYQAKEERQGQGLAEWLLENANENDAVGYDPRLHTMAQISALTEKLKAKNIALQPVPYNPLDAIWHDRPQPPMDPVEIFPESVAGRSAQEKREDIAAAVVKNRAIAAVITLPDSIAWMLNIRGADVPHTPFVLANAIVHDNGDVDLFVDMAKVSPDVRAHLGDRVQLRAPDTLVEMLKDLAQKSAQMDKPVMLDYKNSAIWFKQALEAAGGKIKNAEDPCILPKACKNAVEQRAIREAHRRDGVAETKFLAWFDREAARGHLTEMTVAEKLEEFRRQQPGYRDTSFDTIAGWNANGAIVHYRATEEKHAPIRPPGILLLDSGAQYEDGTTDITRTIAVGEPTPEQKKAFTLVLKGHIAIASHVFPVGTRGVDIDVLARRPLLQHRMNYGHGTGHGVGLYLSVHEQGTGISHRAESVFKPGMLVSNEPGYYKKDVFGIRIENLVMVVDDGYMEDGQTPAMKFETVTLVPIDRRLIDLTQMNDDEIEWLNDYHACVEREIGPHLDPSERNWLQEACKPLKKPDAAEAPKPRRRQKSGPAPV